MSQRQAIRKNVMSQHESGGDWLRPIRGSWPDAVCRELDLAPSVARAVVVSAQGSVPREPGACMLVSAHTVTGTIGGGRLEWEALQLALGSIKSAHSPAVMTRRLVLARELGQCCGGVVELWIERFTRRDLPILRCAAEAARAAQPVLMSTILGSAGIARRVMHANTPAFLPPQVRATADALLEGTSGSSVRFVRFESGNTSRNGVALLERLNPTESCLWLYGAGHVGQAIVRALADLPFQITWVDSRAEIFPRPLPAGVRVVHAPSPAAEVANAPPGVKHLVMTHDHGLDYEICRAVLRREDSAWLGLIGSASKGARFRARLRREGIAEGAIRRLVCPIGIEGVEGKSPAAIAISVAAQLLSTRAEATESLTRCAAQRVPDEARDWGVQPGAAVQPEFVECSPESCRSCLAARSVRA